MNKKQTLLIILVFTIAIRLVFAFAWHEVWWDSGVYIGMGKYAYSAGESGLWEHIRPPLIPLILGALWKLGLPVLLFGRLIQIAFMTGVVWLTYELAQHWFSHRTAILSSLIISFSPIFYYLSFHQYTEITSTFFLLFTLYLAIKKKYFLSGLSAGLAVLAKFPAGIVLASLILLFAANKQFKPLLLTGAGFSIIGIPYLAWSWIFYGGPFATLLAAQQAISRALGCNVLRAKPWWQYFSWIIHETKLHFLAIPGIYALKKQWSKKQTLYVLSLLLPLAYFIQLHCRDYRYLTLFLPFVAMLTALGALWCYDKLNIKKKHIALVLLILLSLWMLNTTMGFYTANEPQQPNPIVEDYYQYIKTHSLSGELWISNPAMAAYTDAKLEKLYYPIYDEKVSLQFLNYLKKNPEKIGAVFLDNCGGGIICPLEDTTCTEQTTDIIEQLDKHYSRVFDKTHGRCGYTIWTTSSP